MKVYIDPRSTIHYSSYYIQGLYDFFSKKNVHFSSKYFKDLKEIDILMALVFVNKDQIKKIIIDYRDQDDIITEAHQWCDAYAKINVSDSTISDNDNKTFNIPPSFGIKIWNPFQLGFHLCKNFLDAKIIFNRNIKNIHITPKLWCLNYLSLRKRQTLENYSRKDSFSNNNYVFFISTLWKGFDNTNLYRKQYILSCAQNEKINFEGGFFISKNVEIPSDIPRKFTFNSYFPNKYYLKNMKKSIFVFNTPAVHDCLGWKLGEFLCMGKAIISTPLLRKMPFQLEHNKDILFVNTQKEIENAITLLLEDEPMRKKLEENSRNYYDKYASPKKVIEYIFSKVEPDQNAATHS